MDLEQTQKRERYNLLCQRIAEAKQSVGSNLYDIGLYLLEIRKKQLYLVEFEAFETFLSKRVEIARSTAFHSMKIAQEFSLRDWQQFGIGKCQLILKLDESIRLDFIKKEGPEKLSYRETKEKVFEYSQEKGIERTETALKGIKPGKPPRTQGEGEALYKGQNEGKKLSDLADEIIRLKELWNNRFKAWLEQKYDLIPLKHELIRKSEKIN